MNEVTQVSDAGLNSLSGFAFQMKIFVYLLVLAKSGEQVEFETLDDITVRDISSLSREDDFLKKSTVGSEITVFQVKQTTVNLDTSRKVLYNWLLALNQDRSITKFCLYVDKNYPAQMSVFDHSGNAEFKRICNSNRAENSLIGRIKTLYKDREADFIQDFQHIKSSHELISIDCDNELSHALAEVFHSEANSVGSVYFEQRVKELIVRICANALECAGKRIPYICSKSEYMQICEEICKNISAERYNPSYTDFYQVYSKNDIDDEVTSSREYIQLTYCSLSQQQIREHLTWEQYYIGIRQHHLRDAKSSIIANAEDIGFIVSVKPDGI